MDYISLYCGLYTILANCAELGESARELNSLCFAPSLLGVPAEGSGGSHKPDKN